MRMNIKKFDPRLAGAAAFFLGLVLFAVLAFWYDATRSSPVPVQSTQAPSTLSVTSAADQGQGSLREALFLAAAADARTTIVVAVDRIEIATPLPPLASQYGIAIVAGPQSRAEVDAQGLSAGPVFDVNGQNSSIEGLTIRNCAAAGVLLRAARFRMAATTIEACDVGVDVAANAADVALEQNRFTRNRVGIRLA